MSEASEDIAPQSRGILQTFVYGGRHKFVLHHTNVYKIMRFFGVMSLSVFISQT